REHSNRLCPSWLVWKPVGNTRRVGSRKRRLGVYHASRTFRQQTQSRPDQANPGTGEYPWGVTGKSEGNAGSGGRNFGSQIRRGRADQQTRGCICRAACEEPTGTRNSGNVIETHEHAGDFRDSVSSG